MRKAVAVAMMLLLAGTAYAGIGFSFGIQYHSHPYRYYPRHVWAHPGPYYYWWYPSYSVVGYYNPLLEVRCEVKPESATVLVDGYYAGRVDDFDGFFQRLKLTPGKHTLTFRNPGYVPYSVSVYGARGQDVHIKQSLMPGEDRLSDDSRMQMQQGTEGRGRLVQPDGGEAYERPRGGYQQPHGGHEQPRYEDRPATPQSSPSPRVAGQGMVRIRINPAGATVYIDGNFWGVIREEGSVEMQLSEGSHRIEVVMPGFQTFRQQVDVRQGQDVNVEAMLVTERGDRNL